MTVEANDDSLPAKTSTILTGQFISLTDYLCHNNETGLCAAELSFINNIAAVQSMQCSNSSLQTPEMNADRNRKCKLQYPENWHYGIQQSSWFG